MIISVLIPTYKRLELLKRAIEDVRSQTYEDWELVISDDEVGDNETWQWLTREMSNDPRIRIIKNLQDKHGQVFNVNNGLRACKGEWIKPFFDDDRMNRDCLEKMVGMIKRLERVEEELGERIVMLGCRAQRWRKGRFVGDEKDFLIKPSKPNDGSKLVMNVILQKDCLRAICMYDRWNGRTPTHMLIRRSAIEVGAFMPEDGRYFVPVDIAWFSRILEHGAYAMTNETLVGQCEGEVESITSGAKSDEFSLDNELKVVYSDIFESIPAERRHSLSLRDIISEINGIRGIYHIRCGRWFGGVKMILKSIGFDKGLVLVIRWLLQEMFPQRFPATKRLVVCE